MATILVVDDEPSNLEVMTAMIERRGHMVLPSASGEEAIRTVKMHPGPIDLIVADVILPDLDVTQVAKKINSVRPGVPFLFVSGMSVEALEGRLPEPEMSEGRVAFLGKPFTTDRLMDKVDCLLELAPHAGDAVGDCDTPAPATCGEPRRR